MFNHSQCLLPDCIILILNVNINMHVFSYICSLKILLLMVLLWRISQGFENKLATARILPLLGNMLPAALDLLKIITFNALN